MRGILFVLLLGSAPLFAAPVAPGTLFYPADQEVMFIAGLTEPLTPYGAGRALAECDANVESDICVHARMLRDTETPLADYEFKHWRERVIFFGENHLDPADKTFLAANLERVRAAGIGAVAFEMFNVSAQDLLDRYARNEATLEDVRKKLESEWGYRSEGYIDVITEAHRLGMKLIALDDRPSFRMSDFFAEIRARDEHMAAVLGAALAADPNLRVVDLTGRLHALKAYSREGLVPSLPSRMRDDYGVSTRSVLTFGPLDRAPLNSLVKAMFGDDATAAAILPEDYGFVDELLFVR